MKVKKHDPVNIVYKISKLIRQLTDEDFKELEDMLEFSVNIKKPVLLRYPRGSEEICFDACSEIEFGKAEVLEKGNDVTIIAIGKMVSTANNRRWKYSKWIRNKSRRSN